MNKVIPFKEGQATAGDDALEHIDIWKEEIVPHSKVVMIFSDASGAYHTYAVNCNMAEAVGYAAFAKEMLIDQVRPK